MKPFISLMNTQSFYYIWHNKETKKYLEKVIKIITNKKEKYNLLETFNYQNQYLRSFIFLESKETLIMIDFNNSKKYNKLKLNQDIYKFLKLTMNKSVIMIMFSNQYKNNTVIDNQYFINRNKKNKSEIKLLLSKSHFEQLKYNQNNVIEYLYSLGEEFQIKYLNEIQKEENIYKLLKL